MPAGQLQSGFLPVGFPVCLKHIMAVYAFSTFLFFFFHFSFFVSPLPSQAAWRTGACVLGGVLEGVFGAEVCREGVSESGLHCDHLLENR